MATFFTSDTHFGHTGIIQACNRPFISTEFMDEALIRNWNATVGPNDDVWHLGDFTLKNHNVAKNYARCLNGRIHLVWGNHDVDQVRRADWWASSQPMAELMLDGHHIVLCHYGMRLWNRSHWGSLSLFGHSHGRLPGNSQSLDVGVDAWDYRPVTLPEILERMQTLPPFVQEDWPK